MTTGGNVSDSRPSRIISVLALIAVATAVWGTSVLAPYRPVPGDNARLTPVRRLATRHVRTAARPAGPGVASRRLDGEFQIDTTFGLAGEPDRQGLAACASDGEQYLAVWEDDHGGRHISGSRVSAQGVVLDPFDIAITEPQTNRSPAAPAVCFVGSDYLVVWTDVVNGTPMVLGCRVGRDGVLLDSIPIRISSTPRPQAGVGAASDGVNSLVVWQNGGAADSATIYGARVGPTGVVLDSISFPIPESAAAQAEPAVAFDGSGWFVVWSQSRPDSGLDILGRHLGLNGAVLDSHDVVISNAARDQDAPCVAFDGTDCLVAWSDFRNSNAGDIYGARVTGSGDVPDSNGIEICRHDGVQHEPALAFSGAFWLAGWADGRYGNDIYGTRVNPDGSVVDPGGYPIRSGGGSEQYPAVCADSSGRSLVAWENGDIWAARLDSSGTVVDTSGLPLSCVISTQDCPAVASDGANYLAVWDNAGPLGTTICAGRVSPTGQSLDASHLNLSAPNTGYLPAVAFGSNYLAVWWESSDSIALRACRVTAAGAVLDSGGIGFGTQYWQWDAEAVASDGSNFLVVWDAEPLTQGANHIYGIRISAEGSVLDTPFTVVGDTIHGAYYPAVAFNGSDYLVAWADYDWNRWVWSIRAARVSPAGVVRDSSSILLASGFADYPYPAVTSDGTNWLVAWSGTIDGGTYQVRASRVSPDGAVIPAPPVPIALARDSSSGATPHAVFDGADYVVTWQCFQNDQISERATVVSPLGAVLDTATITTMNELWEPLTIAHGPGRQVLAAFGSRTDSVNHFPVNGYRVWGKLSQFTGLAENPGSICRSGSMATVFRGVLYLPEAASHKPQATSWLLDAVGRRVAVLHPGPNDVSRFGAGVYFMRLAGSGKRPAVSKVVIAR
jgi:hypothetical protein